MTNKSRQCTTYPACSAMAHGLRKVQLLQSVADVGLSATSATEPTPPHRFARGVAPGEPLSTFKAAAEHFGVPIYKLRKFAKQGAFPIYRIGNGRALCRLSEVDAAIEASRDGGVQ